MNIFEPIQYRKHIIQFVPDQDIQSPINKDNSDLVQIDFGQGKLSHLSTVKGEIDKRLFSLSPVYMYDHSAIALSTSPFACPWDSCLVGRIAISRAHFYGHVKYSQIAQSFLDDMTSYLNGEGLGFEVFKKDSDEVLESCYGFLHFEYAKDQAQASIDSLVKGGE